jgi:hypothetical protein
MSVFNMIHRNDMIFKKFAIFARFGRNSVGDLHVVLLSIHEFRKNRRIEDLSFLMGVNKLQLSV